MNPSFQKIYSDCKDAQLLKEHSSQCWLLGPKQGIYAIPSKAREHCRREGRQNLKSRRRLVKLHPLGMTQLLQSWTDASCRYGIGSAPDWARWQAGVGGAQEAHPLKDELLAKNRFWDMGTYCLQLCAYQWGIAPSGWPHTVLVKISGHKIKKQKKKQKQNINLDSNGWGIKYIGKRE